MVSIALTAAEECSLICYMQYEPLCATYGDTIRTFSNPCELDVYNCLNPQTRKLSTLSQISHKFFIYILSHSES